MCINSDIFRRVASFGPNVMVREGYLYGYTEGSACRHPVDVPDGHWRVNADMVRACARAEAECVVAQGDYLVLLDTSGAEIFVCPRVPSDPLDDASLRKMIDKFTAARDAGGMCGALMTSGAALQPIFAAFGMQDSFELRFTDVAASCAGVISVAVSEPYEVILMPHVWVM